jgi:hypothetical protein
MAGPQIDHVRKSSSPFFKCKINCGLAMQTKHWTVLLPACAVLLCSAAFAGETSLSGDQLRHAISGKTVYLEISGFELPIQYAPTAR